MHQIKGNIKEIVGKAVKNLDLEAEGKVETFKGQAQNAFPSFFEAFITEAIENQRLYPEYREERKS